MALYQPTNIIPSSYTKGTIDVNDIMKISWQVNGNSAMTAFQIDFYLNDANSTYVTSTGRLTDNCPFYGTDRFGRPEFFTWNTGKTWENWSLNKLTNGNEYKYKITQFYTPNENIYRTVYPNNEIINTTPQPYFVGGADLYILLNITTTLFVSAGDVFEFDTKNNTGSFTNSVRTENFNITISTLPPSNGRNLGEVSNAITVEQTSFSTFITRDKPTLTIFRSSTNQYANEIDFPNGGNIATSIGFFKAIYKQEQGDPIRWVRWQVATATYNTQTEKWVLGDIIQDTSDVYTPTLNYEFNGFFNGQKYAIRAIGESESGQECNSNPTTEGWIYFTINIENQMEYSGKFTVQCLNKENATLLKWEGIEVIPSVTSPKGYNPVLSNGSVMLNGKTGNTEYSVTWDKQGIEPINFAPDWTAALKYKLSKKNVDNTQTVDFSGTTKLYNYVQQEEAYATIGDDRTQNVYKGVYEGRWGTKVAKVTNISISNLSDAFRAESAIDEALRMYTITFYSYYPASIASATLQISCEYYETTATAVILGVIKNYVVVEQSSNIVSREISIENQSITVKLYTYSPEVATLKLDITNVTTERETQGKIFLLSGNDYILSIKYNSLILRSNTSEIARQTIPINSTSMAVIITPTSLNCFYFNENNLLTSMQSNINYTQQPITSVSIYGGDSGTTVDSVSVYQGDGSNVLLLYENPDFEPVWNSPDYDLYMTANFNGNLEGGTGTATGTGFRVYRQEVSKNVLTPIATVPSTTTSVKDYGIVSRKAYKYSLYAYDSNGAFMSAVENEKVVATCLKNYSLLVCDYDEINDEYHVRKQYLFALNPTESGVGNNNSPTLNANFTRYPTRMPSTQNYASGTLQGLIGAIYTVPALIEQMGNYKYTAKPSTLDYFDNVDLEKELYDLSTAPYQLFLRDMKGRLRMIHTNAPISMTTDIKQKQQSISISFPWVEIGDASDVTIIQTPDDYGWNNDNQVLDIQLDVDVATGELSATYPFPYSGTKFYLTGVNKETLMAKTPLGITPAQFELSEVAEQPDDGELNATVKVSSEDN